MTQHEESRAQHEVSPEPLEPLAAIAMRVRKLRKDRGWTAARLADEMSKVGVNWDRSIVANLENGRRSTLTVTELLALAYVLDIAPVHLMVPEDDSTPYRVTATLAPPSATVRQWVRGWPHCRDGLEGSDGHLYRRHTPHSEDVMVTLTSGEWEAMRKMAGREDNDG